MNGKLQILFVQLWINAIANSSITCTTDYNIRVRVALLTKCPLQVSALQNMCDQFLGRQ
ncbi:hypothetical protein [Nostoc sp.]|uniref:hypothetical protein n=1 Tax=Nostoc sp. TaxID=1180 RepID=UPI003FA5D5B4